MPGFVRRARRSPAAPAEQFVRGRFRGRGCRRFVHAPFTLVRVVLQVDRSWSGHRTDGGARWPGDPSAPSWCSTWCRRSVIGFARASSGSGERPNPPDVPVAGPPAGASRRRSSGGPRYAAHSPRPAARHQPPTLTRHPDPPPAALVVRVWSAERTTRPREAGTHGSHWPRRPVCGPTGDPPRRSASTLAISSVRRTVPGSIPGSFAGWSAARTSVGACHVTATVRSPGQPARPAT